MKKEPSATMMARENFMATFYIPITTNECVMDTETSRAFLSLLKKTYADVGFMLIVPPGLSSITGEERKKLYGSFGAMLETHGSLPVIVLASSRLEDIDLYHSPQESIAYVKTVIDFTAGLPKTAHRMVTFHLNTLLTPEEWIAAGTDDKTRSAFFRTYFTDTVAPALAEIAAYGKNHNIPTNVEASPVPEFGDLPNSEKRSLLGNPFPIYSGRGFDALRALGLGIVLDISHTRTLHVAASLPISDQKITDTYKGLFPEDLRYLRTHTLLNEIEALRAGDIVHLNDGRGLYDPERHVVHEEGVTLGEGDLQNLPELIQQVLKIKDIHVVFEVNETDYKTRPNLQKSIEYLNHLTSNENGG